MLHRLEFVVRAILQIGSFRFTALHFHAEGAFLILDDRKRTHAHFQLLFELLKRGFDYIETL